MDIRLDGKHALVCGSTQGIGRAAAIELALLGAVWCCGAERGGLERVRQELPNESNQEHACLVADFTDPEQVHNRVAAFTRNQHRAHSGQ